jgi:DNA-binding PadR family transcriptional regulator
MVDFEKVSYTVVKGVLPYIILATIRRVGENTLPNILAYIEEEFDTHIPPSTMYGVIYGLERKGYIQIVEDKKYGLSNKGSMLLEKAKKTTERLFPKIEALLET